MAGHAAKETETEEGVEDAGTRDTLDGTHPSWDLEGVTTEGREKVREYG